MQVVRGFNGGEVGGELGSWGVGDRPFIEGTTCAVGTGCKVCTKAEAPVVPLGHAKAELRRQVWISQHCAPGHRK